jgi:transcriptional regulator of nitric oxide reductase
LAPDKRTREAAWPIAVRLLTKAGARLRSEGFYAKELWLSVKFLDRDPENQKWYRKAKCFETQDSLKLIEELEKMWSEMPRRKLLRVGIALSGLVPVGSHQRSLFEDTKRETLMSAIDAVNGKFRDGTVYVADAHPAINTATNAIAFQRIPGEEE